MSSTDSDDGTASGQPAKRRKPWIWLSVVLTIVAAGLLFWALTINSDLDSTQQELAASQQELDKTKQELDASKQEVEQLQSEDGGGIRTRAALVAAKAVYDEFAQQLDATSEDLAATQQDLEEAEKAAAKAEQDAEAAKQDAADAGDETEKAKAQADQAKAEAKAAESKTAVVADCAKAYVSAFGALFEGDTASDQAPEVREQLSDITAVCKDELAGA